jgi:hypothetical protein
MKHHTLAWILALLFVFSIHTVTTAGHSTDNGTCTDDIIHWQNMIEKRTDAPLYEQSKIVQQQAVAKRVTGKTAECETLMEEALRMIRKTELPDAELAKATATGNVKWLKHMPWTSVVRTGLCPTIVSRSSIITADNRSGPSHC